MRSTVRKNSVLVQNDFMGRVQQRRCGPMQIRSKRQFFALWEAGLLGNRTSIWRDPQEAYRVAFEQRNLVDVGFREIRKAGSTGAGAWCKATRGAFWETVHVWRALGRQFIMDDGVPNEKQTLMGEIVRTERGLEGFITLATPLPMRPAMAAGLMKHRSYLETRLLLEQYMDPSSRDDLDSILEMYPDHVVEFSCFSVNVGIFPRRNTMFWEVRNY
jgi:hypothetical protein